MIQELDNAVLALKKLGVHSSFAKKHLLSLIQQNKINTIIKNLQESIKYITLCTICNNISKNTLCNICLDNTRDKSTILMIEHISDLNSIEFSQAYKGLYHVLSHNFFHNNIEQEITQIHDRISKNNINEIIIATNTNLNGEIVSEILLNYIKVPIKISRIANGAPFGCEIHNLDSATILSSISARRLIN